VNTPNRLTLLRMLLIPAYVVLIYIPYEHGILIANIVFIIASATDALDGYIARRDGLVTDFGKLMDPLADKLLVMAAMVVLVDIGFAPAWAVITILAREFLVNLIRQMAAAKGTVIAADNLGKLKTISQMTWLTVGMAYIWADMSLPNNLDWLGLVCTGLCYLTVGLTVLSGANYTVKNKDLFSMK